MGFGSRALYGWTTDTECTENPASAITRGLSGKLFTFIMPWIEREGLVEVSSCCIVGRVLGGRVRKVGEKKIDRARWGT